MSLSTRLATPADQPGWSRMRAQLWPDEGTDHAAEIAEQWASARPQAGILAEWEGELVGFAEVSVRQVVEGCAGDRVGYLEGWFVAASHRGRGVGRALVRAAEDWARAQGCRELGSDTEVENEVSHRAHRACGFEDLGLVRLFRKRL